MMVVITAPRMNAVWRVSVQTTVLIPARWVYSQMLKSDMSTVNQNGIPSWLKNASCKTPAARKRRKEAPMVCESRKNAAPVL